MRKGYKNQYNHQKLYRIVKLKDNNINVYLTEYFAHRFFDTIFYLYVR